MKLWLSAKQGSKRITIDDIAQKLGIINYEVVCMVSFRTPRTYVCHTDIWMNKILDLFVFYLSPSLCPIYFTLDFFGGNPSAQINLLTFLNFSNWEKSWSAVNCGNILLFLMQCSQFFVCYKISTFKYFSCQYTKLYFNSCCACRNNGTKKRRRTGMDTGKKIICFYEDAKKTGFLYKCRQV